MIAVIFEGWTDPAHGAEYLDLAARLRPLLDGVPGFLSVERFRSLSDPEKLLSLSFWGAIWGVPGMFLSTPLTVTAMVILVQFPGTRWIAVLLSADGAPEKYAEDSPDPSEPPHHPEHVTPEPKAKAPSRRKAAG